MEAARRYVGIDLGKREYTLAVIGTDGKMKIHHGKTSVLGRQGLYRLLERTDKVALGAGNLAFIMAREIQERAGSEVRVLNSAKLPFIWDAPTKTDKEGAMKLAHVVGERKDEKLPIVPLPSEEGMGRRKVLASYGREVRNRTGQINTLHALFWTLPRWVDTIKRLAELRGKIRGEAKRDEAMKLLRTVAGVGAVVAYAYVAHVGDGSRFTEGAQVSNYLGLVPRLDYSGTVRRQGHIWKRGNGYVRGLLEQAAWSGVRSQYGGVLGERYKTITKGMGKKKTVVAIAGRLAGLMYSVLKTGSAYEPRPWKGVQNDSVHLAERALSA